MSRALSTAGIGMTSHRTRARLIERLRMDGIRDERVLEAMLHTPRHLFVDEALSAHAYDDTALPIGKDQTISQPYIVALMTELLLDGRERLARVLEVGTGCGYQSAILARCAVTVYSVERDNDLLREARRLLARLDLRNVLFANRDGFQGWPAHAPYDGIIVTAAPPAVPQALPQQLAPGGRMVLPVGDGDEQRLRVLCRTPEGVLSTMHERVMFVPMREGLQR